VDTSSLTKELLSSSEKQTGREIPKRDFINRINYANFEHIPLTLVFQHKRLDRTLSVSAFPEPCFSDELTLKWADSKTEGENLENFHPLRILIPGFENTLEFPPVNCLFFSDGISLSLPDSAFEVQRRGKIRENCLPVEVALIQNGTTFSGTIKNFHSESFLVKLEKEGNSPFKLLNREENLSLLIRSENQMIFSGLCRVSSRRSVSGGCELVLQPLSSSFKRFRGKEFRGERYDLKSSLQVGFTHPLSGLEKHLMVRDLSGSGLSVYEKESKSLLFAGLLLPELRIILPGNSFLTCRAQVIYSGKKCEKESGYILAGLAILDMNPHEYTRLLDYIHYEIDSRSNISHTVDTKALWRFFFESGFIYPEKYRYLLGDIDKIRELYDRLYNGQPAIARHFIYQKDDQIQGHMSMLRSYENSWLLHHHASSSINGQNAGLDVLNQVGSFTNNCTHIESMHLDYLFCYFRRENKFPNRMFGGMAEKINDRGKCSLDDWAYFHFKKDQIPDSPDDSIWRIDPSSKGELKDLQAFYEEREGGLMLKNFNLDEGVLKSSTLLRDYRSSGFTRDVSFHSLKKGDSTCAIFMADRTDTGLNMSDLTNSIKLFLINPRDLDRSVIGQALQQLSEFYPCNGPVPALVYPLEYARDLQLHIDKIYTMWVLDQEAGDLYFHHLKKLIRKIHH